MIFLLIPLGLVVAYFVLGGATGKTPPAAGAGNAYLNSAPTYPGGTISAVTSQAHTYTNLADPAGVSPWAGAPIAQRSTAPGAAPVGLVGLPNATLYSNQAAATLARVTAPPSGGTYTAPAAVAPPASTVPGAKPPGISPLAWKAASKLTAPKGLT